MEREAVANPEANPEAALNGLWVVSRYYNRLHLHYPAYFRVTYQINQ